MAPFIPFVPAKNEFELQTRLQKMAMKMDCVVIQENGQRIIRPPASARIPPPPRGCEIIIRNLPTDFYEDRLIPIFRSAGEIYNVRMMMDFTGKTRGFAFIAYFTPHDAQSAVELFHGCKISVDQPMAVMISRDNRRLYIGNIDRSYQARDVLQIINQYVDGVTLVIVQQNPFAPWINRGYAFVEFESQKMAAIARRSLSPRCFPGIEENWIVDWAAPIPIVRPQVSNEVKEIFVSNVPLHICSFNFESFIRDYLKVYDHDIVQVKKKSYYAFIRFGHREIAQFALMIFRLKKVELCGQVLDVQWARPIEYRMRRVKG